MAVKRRGPAVTTQRVDFGVAELVPDTDRPNGWTLLIDGTPQSYVDVDDSTCLEFEYMRRIASVIDTAAPPGQPLRVLHLGGGALTLPRYVAATRPLSVQRVIEHDAALTALVRRVLPLPRGANVRVRVSDARGAVESVRTGSFDGVVTDVYTGARMPGRLATVEFAGQLARVLRPTGFYTANIADGPPLTFARGQVATLRTAFGEVCLIAEPGVLRGRRFGNLVLVAAPTGGQLPTGELTVAALRDAFPARLLHGAELDRFVAGAGVMTDDKAQDSPEPPPGLFPRRRAGRARA